MWVYVRGSNYPINPDLNRDVKLNFKCRLNISTIANTLHELVHQIDVRCYKICVLFVLLGLSTRMEIGVITEIYIVHFVSSFGTFPNIIINSMLRRHFDIATKLFPLQWLSMISEHTLKPKDRHIIHISQCLKGYPASSRASSSKK